MKLQIRKALTAVLLTVCLAGLGWAQPFSRSQAVRYAQQLSQSSDLKDNVRLRSQVLAKELQDGQSDTGVSDLLDFFGDTRVLMWNYPVGASDESTMLELENQMQQLAAEKGTVLNLQSVGYSPYKRAKLLSSERATATGITNLTLATEQVATELLSTSDSPELRRVRDSLTTLRSELGDQSVSTRAIRDVVSAWAVFTTKANPRLINDPRLDTLERLVVTLRGTASDLSSDVDVSLVE